MTCEQELDFLKEQINLYRYDFLTGLKQRRDFDFDLRERFATKKFYVCYYDVNNLHKVNRTKGFAQGDLLLRQVANDIQHQSTPHQTYRPTGDEMFTICCNQPTAPVSNATMVCANARDFPTVDALLSFLDDEMIKAKGGLARRSED